VLDPPTAGPTAAPHVGSPPSVLGSDGEVSSHALQIMMTEHWSLLTSRSLGYTESMARTSIFVAALTGSVVALALVAQATDFGDGFVAFALVLLPVVFFLGVVTVARLAQNGWEDGVWVQGMNRLRHAYLELAPELEPYFVASPYDDDEGVLISSIARSRVTPHTQAFIAIPGVVAVLDSVVAGAVAGIAAHALDAGTAAAISTAAAMFVVSVLGFATWAVLTVASYRRRIVVRFPTPSTEPETGDQPPARTPSQGREV
jgi:hypothetical protein